MDGQDSHSLNSLLGQRLRLPGVFVHSTPSLAGGALARSLTMPAPIEKSKTFCQPSWFILPQVGMAGDH